MSSEADQISSVLAQVRQLGVSLTIPTEETWTQLASQLPPGYSLAVYTSVGLGKLAINEGTAYGWDGSSITFIPPATPEHLERVWRRQ